MKYYEINSIRVSSDNKIIVKDLDKLRRFLLKRIGKKVKIDFSYRIIYEEAH